MTETLDIADYAGFNHGILRPVTEFSRDEIAAIHHSEHTVFTVAELIASAEQRMKSVASNAGKATKNFAQIRPEQEIQLQLY